jgi:hypothetical protein
MDSHGGGPRSTATTRFEDGIAPPVATGLVMGHEEMSLHEKFQDPADEVGQRDGICETHEGPNDDVLGVSPLLLPSDVSETKQ